MKDQQICNIISSRVILARKQSILWVLSIEMNENNRFFGYTLCFLDEKS